MTTSQKEEILLLFKEKARIQSVSDHSIDLMEIIIGLSTQAKEISDLAENTFIKLKKSLIES